MIYAAFALGAGWLSGAVLFYSIHRWVFHSKKNSLAYKILFHKYNPLRLLARKGRKIHIEHHKETIKYGQKVTEHMNIFFPLWAKVLTGTVVLGSAFIFGPLPTIGLVSFFPFYAYRHKKAHELFHRDDKRPWVEHHMSHHQRDPQTNFSGTVPLIDKVFGTYES